MQDVEGAAAADAARSHETSRVLVVDDNENNLLVLKNMLVPNGYIVELARSGEECLQILSSRIGTGQRKVHSHTQGATDFKTAAGRRLHSPPFVCSLCRRLSHRLSFRKLQKRVLYYFSFVFFFF